MPTLKRPGQPDLHYVVDDYTDPWRDAPTLLLQHGNGRASRFWYSWISYLSRHYKIVRPDARGLGQSGTNFDITSGVTVDALIDDLRALIEHLGVAPVHYCGESMGGILGVALAAQHPELVRTLTLVATPVYISGKMKQNYALGHASRQEAVQAMGRAAWIRATNRSTRFPPDTDPAFLDWYEQEFAKSNADVQAAMTRLANQVNIVPYLERLKIPVLGLYPTAGPITDADQEQLLKDSLQSFELVHLPTQYHMVHHIFPEVCTQHLLRFLTRHDAGESSPFKGAAS